MGLTMISEAYINQCLDYFGGIGLDILQEECAELIQACSKMKRHDGHFSYVDPIEQLKEEMAHVLISLEVVARLHGVTSKDLANELTKKAKKYNFEGELLCHTKL